MAKYCENCGCKVYNGACVNCHEENYILDQYYEQDMTPPREDTDFMKKVRQNDIEIEKNRRNELHS